MTSSEKFAIQSMAMDLKRVSLGIHNGSYTMAERFLEEAKKRKDEINGSYPAYIANIFKLINRIELKKKNSAEDAMMYSTLLQNFSV